MHNYGLLLMPNMAGTELLNMQGFKRVKDNLEDICLDNPQGADQLQKVSSQGIAQGWLESDWDQQAPSTLRSSLTLGSSRSLQVPHTA